MSSRDYASQVISAILVPLRQMTSIKFVLLVITVLLVQLFHNDAQRDFTTRKRVRSLKMNAGLANLGNTALRTTLFHAFVRKVTTVQQLRLSLLLAAVDNTSHFWASMLQHTVWTVRWDSSVMQMVLLTTTFGSALLAITVMK